MGGWGPRALPDEGGSEWAPQGLPSPLHHPFLSLYLCLSEPPQSTHLLSPHLSISVSFYFSGHFVLSPHPPFLSPFPFFSLSIISPSLSPPPSVSLLLHPPRPFARWRGGEDHPPITAQLLQHLQPQRLKERELSFRGHIWGAPAGITASPQHPTGLSLLSLLPSAWETQGFIPGSTTVTLVSRAISVLPGGAPLHSPRQVPLLCFYILN